MLASLLLLEGLTHLLPVQTFHSRPRLLFSSQFGEWHFGLLVSVKRCGTKSSVTIKRGHELGYEGKKASRKFIEVECPACLHELVPRSRWPAGFLVESNCVALCAKDHRWIHDNPKLATEAGWLKRREL